MCDACEQQPCAIQLKEDVSELLAEIDSLARDFDGYDYGLPLGSDEGPDAEMREAVMKFLVKYRPDIAAADPTPSAKTAAGETEVSCE